MASPSPVLGGSPQSAGNRIRDGLATTLGKSYGTVKDASLNMSSSYRCVINHDVVEEDTLQGLALKYNVTVRLVNSIYPMDFFSVYFPYLFCVCSGFAYKYMKEYRPHNICM